MLIKFCSTKKLNTTAQTAIKDTQTKTRLPIVGKLTADCLLVFICFILLKRKYHLYDLSESNIYLPSAQWRVNGGFALMILTVRVLRITKGNIQTKISTSNVDLRLFLLFILTLFFTT